MIIIEECLNESSLYNEDWQCMQQYIMKNGWHFNESLCNLAISKMVKNNTPITKMLREDIDKLLTLHNIKLNNNKGWDYVFVANMAKADYLGSSIADDRHLALYIKDTIDDEDMDEGTTLRRWCATMTSNKCLIDWLSAL